MYVCIYIHRIYRERERFCFAKGGPAQKLQLRKKFMNVLAILIAFFFCHVSRIHFFGKRFFKPNQIPMT
jgi:hypothetical protein